MEKTRKLQGSQPVETLEVVKRLLVGRPSSFEDCIEWARKYWQEMFHNQIAQLLHNFPADQVTSTGQPFWSGPKVSRYAILKVEWSCLILNCSIQLKELMINSFVF